MINYILLLMAFHWFADFVMQSDKMAKNKSSSNKWLGKHILVYGICFLPLSYGYGFKVFLPWILLNMAAHFITDYFTSRATKRLWEMNDSHNFFVVVGFDQLLHYAVLIISFKEMVLNAPKV